MGELRSSNIFSTLPDNITEIILKCLPLRDAARTSILSREWRYRWITIPVIVFDRWLPLELQESQKFKTIFYQVLLLHKGPILKFTLSVRGLRSCPDINHWILFLSKNNVQEFTLCIYEGDPHILPSHLFTFRQLRHLNLSNCVFKPLPTFEGFSRLVSLLFSGVIIVPERFVWLISNSPELEQFWWDGCTEFDCLEIDAPRLKTFSFFWHFQIHLFQEHPSSCGNLDESNFHGCECGSPWGRKKLLIVSSF
ncbi:unnamed protein product [Ilex paraguariensis]|uniref:F-box domain-containing protein n=1 Tax=Ilex paraguariensis TaxID=185542 RepID=A0ABC8UU71_9AQUA